jgi:hypothetical protein
MTGGLLPRPTPWPPLTLPQSALTCDPVPMQGLWGARSLPGL